MSMKFYKVYVTAIVVLIFFGLETVQSRDRDVMIASAAGYKKPMIDVLKSYKKRTGIEIDAVFGNMQMVAGQAEQSGEICCIIGDKKFLNKLGSKINFSSYYPIGKGILVLAFRKGILINKPEDLLSEQIQSLFMPQDGKAIYGIAGNEALKACGYDKQIAHKITRVATVPQVVSYLLTGEADAGFINLTEALSNKDKLGGYIIMPQNTYSEIVIVAGVIKGFENNTGTKQFLDFLQSKWAVKIFRAYGLK